MGHYLIFGLEAFFRRPPARHNEGSRLDGWFESCRFFAFAEEIRLYFKATGDILLRTPQDICTRESFPPLCCCSMYFDGLSQVVSLEPKPKWRDHC